MFDKNKDAVAVLVGGELHEQEISERTATRVMTALEARGYTTHLLQVSDLCEALQRKRPSVVFNALQGGRVRIHAQAMLEFFSVPHTHSSVLAACTAIHKWTARAVFAAAGLPCARGHLTTLERALTRDLLPKPYVIKPIEGVASLGMKFVFDDRCKELSAEEKHYWKANETALVEEFIPGRDLTVAILEENPLAVMECQTPQGFLDAHWDGALITEGLSQGVVVIEPTERSQGVCMKTPAPLPASVYEQAMTLAAAAHRALGCCGPTRVDLRYDPSRGQEGLFILELNPFPGLTERSPFPYIAQSVGLSIEDVVEKTLLSALRA